MTIITSRRLEQLRRRAYSSTKLTPEVIDYVNGLRMQVMELQDEAKTKHETTQVTIQPITKLRAGLITEIEHQFRAEWERRGYPVDTIFTDLRAFNASPPWARAPILKDQP